MTALEQAIADHDEATCYCLIEGWQRALDWVLNREEYGRGEVADSLAQAIRYETGDEG